MQWHPYMIRRSLNLKLLSSATYHSLHTSEFIKLPSERTLRDYTHFIKIKAGFSSELDQFLADESLVETLPEWKRHVVLVIDELKVKESLVFDKHETEVVGFVDMGDVSNKHADFERESALPTTSILPLLPICLFSWYEEYSLACNFLMLTSLLRLLKQSIFSKLCGNLSKGLNIRSSRSLLLLQMVHRPIEKCSVCMENLYLSSLAILCTKQPTSTVKRGAHLFYV